MHRSITLLRGPLNVTLRQRSFEKIRTQSSNNIPFELKGTLGHDARHHGFGYQNQFFRKHLDSYIV